MKRSTAATIVCSVWAFGATMFLGELYNASVERVALQEASAFPYGPLPECQEEDGSDIDGYCVWISKTGDMYLNPTPEEMKR